MKNFFSPFEWDIPALLGREEHPFPESVLRGALEGKRIFVTGGAGSIGSAFVRLALACGAEKIIVFDQSEHAIFMLSQSLSDEQKSRVLLRLGSVRDSDALNRSVTACTPDLFIHAAALKHVPILEENEYEGTQTNVYGTLNAVVAAQACNVKKFVLLSTDKAAEPNCVLGKTKREAERIVREHGGSAVRFGNVLGTDGSVAQTFYELVRRGVPLPITHPEMKRYFMSVREAASAIGAVCAQSDPGVYVADMGEEIYLTDFARRMARRYGSKEAELYFIGIRPGEKLCETLVDKGERLLPTELPGLYRCVCN